MIVVAVVVVDANAVVAAVVEVKIVRAVHVHKKSTKISTWPHNMNSQRKFRVGTETRYYAIVYAMNDMAFHTPWYLQEVGFPHLRSLTSHHSPLSPVGLERRRRSVLH